MKTKPRFVKDNIDAPKLELLPYHSFGDSKYEALGLEKPSRQFGTPSPDYLRELNNIVRNEGVEVVSYK
ncbi:MAG: pyruvate formate lyase activating enzyme [Clostridium sp.]